MHWIGSAALCVVLLTAVARAVTSADCDAPAAMSDDWAVATPAQQGLDPKLICAIGPGLAELKRADPHGVVVVRAGHLQQQPRKHPAVGVYRPRSLSVRAGTFRRSDAGDRVELQRWWCLAAWPRAEEDRGTAARAIRQRGIIRASRDTGLGVGTLPKWRSGHVRQLASATARLGQARPTRARRWRMARAADRL